MKHLLVVGLGSIGARHARNLINLNHKVSALICRSGGVPKEFQNVDHYYNFDDLDLDNIDGAIICTPTAFHMEYIEKFVHRGMPVLVEKPISHQMTGVEEIAIKIKEFKVPVMVGFNFRYHPQINKIKQILDEGKLGNYLYANLCWSDDIREWYKDGRYKVNYTSRPELGGGALRTMCHELDLARWFFGKHEKAEGCARKISLLDIGEVDDIFTGSLCYQGEFRCMIHLDFITKVPNRMITIAGEKGTIIWDYYNGKLTYKIEGQQEHSEIIGPVTAEFKNEMYLEEVKDFIALIDGKGINPIPFDDGVEVQKTISDFLN